MNDKSDLITRLRTMMKHSAAYSARDNEERLIALGKEAADELERLRLKIFNDHNAKPICNCLDCQAHRKRRGIYAE